MSAGGGSSSSSSFVGFSSSSSSTSEGNQHQHPGPGPGEFTINIKHQQELSSSTTIVGVASSTLEEDHSSSIPDYDNDYAPNPEDGSQRDGVSFLGGAKEAAGGGATISSGKRTFQ